MEKKKEYTYTLHKVLAYIEQTSVKNQNAILKKLQEVTKLPEAVRKAKALLPKGYAVVPTKKS